MRKITYLVYIALVAVISTSVANAAAVGATISISDAHIQAAISGTVGSGNGTLDIKAFTQGVNNNTAQFDDGNTNLSNTGGGDSGFWKESYVTTAGKLKDFYRLNFDVDPAKHGQIMLALDLNETGGGLPENYFSKIDIVLNPTNIFGSPNPVIEDVQSAVQNAIDQQYDPGSGTLLAELELLNIIADPESTTGGTIGASENLVGVSQGGGFADFFVLTGINVFDFLDDDIILINISMNNLSNGSETIFVSGTHSADDVCVNVSCPAPPVNPSIPTPSVLILLLTGFFCLTGMKKIKLYG